MLTILKLILIGGGLIAVGLLASMLLGAVIVVVGNVDAGLIVSRSLQIVGLLYVSYLVGKDYIGR